MTDDIGIVPASIPSAAAEYIFGAVTWCRYQAECAMDISSGAATTHGDDSGALQMLNSIASDIEINLHMLEDFLAAQGIAARSDETRSGSAEGKSPVAESDAPSPNPLNSGDHHD